MATPAEVIELFAGLREGSSFARAKSAAEVFRAFASLSPQQKRDLAVVVAERAAPHLVPRIEQETGLDLTREQVQAVLDMAGRMDADDLDELAHTVRDREARGEALRSAATAAAAASGLDDVVDAPEEAEEADVPEPPVDEAELEDLGVELEPAELDRQPEPTVEVAPAPEPKAFVSIFDALPDAPGQWEPEQRLATRSRPTTPSHAADTADLTTRVRAARQPLVERLRAAGSNARRLRLLRASLDDVLTMDRSGRIAVVDAVPDGWARRRALETLLEAQVLPAAEVPALIRRIDSPVSRAWVCASAIEADMLRLDDVDGLVDERATDRLRRRYG